MATRFSDHLLTGDHASRPAATTVPDGTLYSCTDHSLVYQSDGATWSTWATLGAPLAGATFTGAVEVPDDAYDASTWNGNEEVPTKNAVRDKIESLAAGSSVVVQVVSTQTGAVATGGTVIPLDDSIPQNGEGDEYMTLAITPASATNKLQIDVVFMGSSNAANWLSAALFQDSTANALAATSSYESVAGGGQVLTIRHTMTAGTTSATTFKVRAGRDASAGTTITFNGSVGGRLFGGVMASSITITEYIP